MPLNLNVKMRMRESGGRVAIILTLMGLAFSDPAYAQIQKLTTVMDNVKTALTGIGVVAFTIAIGWAGYKMAFQHAKWSEIANIIIGGVLVGGAAEIAGWLIN